MPVPFHEGQAEGQQQGSPSGARGGGTAEARARPNVEVNRRAEGTSELNRRLGAVEKGAVSLERCGAAGDYGRGLAGKQARRACVVPRRPSSRPATEQRRRSPRVWYVEVKPRPNVEVNRRAEGTSGLNRRLGAGVKGDWALDCCGAAGDYGWGGGGKQARCTCFVSRRPSSRTAAWWRSRIVRA